MASCFALPVSDAAELSVRANAVPSNTKSMTEYSGVFVFGPSGRVAVLFRQKCTLYIYCIFKCTLSYIKCGHMTAFRDWLLAVGHVISYNLYQEHMSRRQLSPECLQ